MIHKAKKSMGQNFLKSEVALRKICEMGEIKNTDTILEIGPGKGALTKKLLEQAGRVIAVEKDRELFEFLQEKFAEEIKIKKLELVCGDILEFEFPLPLLRGGMGRGQLNKDLPSFPSLVRRGGINPYKLISNIPYNITGAILKKFLTSDNQPERMVLLVQKEVAERIVARDGKESILSLSVKAYGEPKYIMKVSKRFFSPSPKVDSAIIKIGNISKGNFRSVSEENLFFELVKAGFAHKRKVLRKNLEVGLPEIKTKEVGLPYISKIDEIFEKLGINSKARAEDVSFEKWIEITRHLSTDF